MTKEELAKMAEEVLKEVKDYYYNSNGFDTIDPIKIARYYDISVRNAGYDNRYLNGYILTNRDGFRMCTLWLYKVITVEINLTNEQKTFIIAKQLGYYFMHKNERVIAHREFEYDKETRSSKELSYFARCLLMPQELFQRYINAVNEYVKRNKDFENNWIDILVKIFMLEKDVVYDRIADLLSENKLDLGDLKLNTDFL